MSDVTAVVTIRLLKLQYGVGDGSVVEPAPPDIQVLRGCGFELVLVRSQ